MGVRFGVETMYGMRNIENIHWGTMSENLGGDNGIIKPYGGPSKPFVCLLHTLSQGSVGNREKQQGRAVDKGDAREGSWEMAKSGSYGKHNFLMWLFIIMWCGFFIMSRGYFIMSRGYFIVCCSYFIVF